MRGIDKYFGINRVLTEAQFSLSDREIHALVGENGAGKSTLMNILTGVHQRDSGEILVNGDPVTFHHPKEAEKAGISFIHQELNVMPHLTVEQNLFMGKEIKNKLGMLDKSEMEKRTNDVMNKLGADISPNTPMNMLSIGQQQMVEIAKALMEDAKVIIMDEPTAALTPSETETLFTVVRSLRNNGVSIIYISHRMEEIFDLSDRITVLRDGIYVGTKETENTEVSEIVRMMIGRDIGDHYPSRSPDIGRPMLELSGFTRKGEFDNVSFTVHAGEILGVAGLMGAGRTEIAKAIFGSSTVDSGKMYIDSQEVFINNPKEAIHNGIGYITEDRKNEGLLLNEDIVKNVALTNLKTIAEHGIISRDTEMDLATRAMDEFSIRASSVYQTTGSLSGGNQQKVVLAKWIFTDPRILILDEPTRGVDIGAKKEIYTIVNDLADRGVAIIFISSDLPEVLGVSDRIMAVYQGQIAGTIERENATEEKIMTLATGGTLNE